jgi:effector-binding domain-containing protein
MSAYAVRLEPLASVPLAVVQRQAQPSDLPRIVPECCGLVWNALRAQGVRGGRHVALYWEWHPSIRLEVGAEVSDPFTEQDGLVRSATPAGTVASVTHFGPYSHLRAAHDALHAWCKGGPHELAGPSWEIYGHWQPEWDTNPAQIRTDIFYLIRS